MQLTESSIFLGLKRLRNRLYSCQFLMQKADRIVYGTPMMQECGKAIAAFVLAFDVKDKRLEYLEECIGHFAVLRTDLEFCVEQNIIKFSKPKKAEGDESTYINTQKVELFKLVASIDEDMCRWLASLTKGKTAFDKQ